MKICNEKKGVTTMVNLSKVAEMIQFSSRLFAKGRGLLLW